MAKALGTYLGRCVRPWRELYLVNGEIEAIYSKVLRTSVWDIPLHYQGLHV